MNRSADPQPEALVPDQDLDITTYEDVDATTHEDVDATTHEDVDATTHEDVDATTHEDVDATMRAARVISAIVAESVAQAGDQVTMPQLRTLVLIATREGINTSAVAAALDIHPSNASRLTERLVQAGLVARTPDTDDRRTVVLSLTTSGSDLVAAVMDYRRTRFRAVLSALEPAARRQLRLSLDAFSEAADEPPEKPRADPLLLLDPEGHHDRL